MVTLVILFSVFCVVDAVMYSNAPYEVRAWHWWSYLPGSGFIAQYKSAQQKMHPTLGESAASDGESQSAPKRVI